MFFSIFIFLSRESYTVALSLGRWTNQQWRNCLEDAHLQVLLTSFHPVNLLLILNQQGKFVLARLTQGHKNAMKAGFDQRSCELFAA